HLIELESILLAGSIGRYRPVMIEDVVDEIRPLDLGQTSRPFDKAHRKKIKKTPPGLEIPGFRFGVNTKYPQAVALGCSRVFFGGEMQVRIVELAEVGDPSRRPAGLFDHIFKTLA